MTNHISTGGFCSHKTVGNNQVQLYQRFVVGTNGTIVSLARDQYHYIIIVLHITDIWYK